jgi:protein ImuA
MSSNLARPLARPLGDAGSKVLQVPRSRLRVGEPRTRHGVLAFGDPRVDACLPEGGLPLGQLHEVGAQGVEAETGAVAAGFICCLLARMAGQQARGMQPVFWISPVCDLHAPGVLAYGLDPGLLIMVRSDNDAQTLAAMETALRAGAAGAVVGEVGRLARTPSRRLQIACLGHGITGFALRRWPWGGRGVDREATAVATRWHIATTPSAGEYHEPGRPRWEVALTHARGGMAGSWIMEVVRDGADAATGGTHAAHPLRVVAELADAAAAPTRRFATG